MIQKTQYNSILIFTDMHVFCRFGLIHTVSAVTSLSHVCHYLLCLLQAMVGGPPMVERKISIDLPNLNPLSMPYSVTPTKKWLKSMIWEKIFHITSIYFLEALLLLITIWVIVFLIRYYFSSFGWFKLLKYA